MDWAATATPLTRGVHVAAVMSLFGCLAFRRFVVRGDGAALPLATLARLEWISLALAIACGAAWLIAVSGAMAGARDLASLLTAVPEVASGTHFGQLLCLRLLLLIGVLMLLPFRRVEVASLLTVGAALGLQPLIGHIGALQPSVRVVLVPVEIAHLLAAGAWVGALLPLLLRVARAPPSLGAMLCERFTPVGLVAVGTILATALPQAGELIGGLPQLFGTAYGHFALIKLGLFALALGLACVNRLALTDRLGAGTARRALLVSIAVETGAVTLVVLAAAWMASSPPAAHVEPVWPFPWRIDASAWREPASRVALFRLLIALAAGLALLGASLFARRFRVLAIVLAAIVVAPFASAASLLLTEAFPTSFARSTTGFSVQAIARGQALYEPLCAACHDPRIGDGGTADLTARHIWGHLDGDLFWRVTDGVTDATGAAVMPGFGSVLSEDDRWALIDFIHARNIGMQMRRTGTWSPPVRAPATPLTCDGEPANSLAELGSHDLIVLAEPAQGAASEIAQGSVPGAEVIRMAREAAAVPGEGECVAASADAWKAWRVLSGVPRERFGGYRAVIDGQGWLRAWLPPDAGLEAISAAVRDARGHPIVSEPRPEGGHHH